MVGTLYAGIDSGGTSTRVIVGNAQSTIAMTRAVGSLNPASVGLDVAMNHFKHYVVEPLHELYLPGYSSVSIVIGSAGYSGSVASEFLGRAEQTMRQFFSSFRLEIMNDVSPLVLSKNRVGAAAIVLGTGSCALAIGTDSLIRVGGAEYVASDQGGATYLGQLGLVLALKGLDGRGRGTLLAHRIGDSFGMSLEGAARKIAETAHPKALLAGLAPVVLECAYSDKDLVAREIVQNALSEIDDMLTAVVRRCPEAKDGPWQCTGGLISHRPEYRMDVERVAASQRLAFEFVDDASMDCLRLARGPGHTPAFVDSVVLERRYG